MSSDFRAELIAAGLLVPTSVDGLYARSGTFERIVRGIENLVSAAGGGDAVPVLHFPPLVPRDVLERSGYLQSFPDLLGAVAVFGGDDKAHTELLELFEGGSDWWRLLTVSDVTMCSAACHPLYPMLTGRLPEGGVLYEVFGQCFRHEPSLDPARMQTFRQHEFVYVGDPEKAVAHRDLWLERSFELLSDIGLEVETALANDPFFGRAGRLLSANQRAETLKYEITCTIAASGAKTAISSSNYHLDHFGQAFSIETANGEPAHSACVGFGAERITLALLRTHGLHPESWPAGVRGRLLD